MPPNVAVAIELSDQERLQLEAWTRRRTSAQALALRARIVLAAAEGRKNTEIAEQLGINRAMAAKWRSRFAEHRLWLLAHPRFELHFTPTSSSWLNLVERWFGELTGKLLKR